MNVIVVFLLALLTIAQDGGSRAREANRAYEQGDFHRAEQLYREILSDQPDNRRVLFNLGNTLAQLGNTEASMEVFQRYQDLTNDPHERSFSEYNLGYLQGETGNAEEAIRHFRNSLELSPADEDAKYNYELLKRRLLDQENQDQQDQQQQQQDSQPPPSSDDDGRSEEDDAGQPASSPMNDPQQTRDERQRGRPEVTDEQLRHAEDIMNALEQIEKDLIRDYKKRQMDPSVRHEKEW